jgi:hypothetical protein
VSTYFELKDRARLCLDGVLARGASSENEEELRFSTSTARSFRISETLRYANLRSCTDDWQSSFRIEL